MGNCSTTVNYFLYLSSSFHPTLRVKTILKFYSAHNWFLWENKTQWHNADGGAEPHWTEGNLLKDSRGIEISLANWLIASTWQLNAFRPLYSQEMYELLCSGILTSNTTNCSSYFLFHKNITGGQCVDVKTKFLHRGQMFMVSIGKERFLLRNDQEKAVGWGTESCSENGLESLSG